jgi:hypothetical protein
MIYTTLGSLFFSVHCPRAYGFVGVDKVGMFEVVLREQGFAWFESK